MDVLNVANADYVWKKEKNFLLHYLRYQYSDQISIYKDYNRIKGSVD